MVLQYQSLDPTRSEVRLLTLKPLTEDGDIQGSLSIASLEDAPRFEALSYVWGDPDITKPIVIDSESIPVTVNLEACLRRLRHADVARALWVDAVCIDQQSIAEKNTQIPLMGRIYSNASSVVIWLGEDDNSCIPTALLWADTYIDKAQESPSKLWTYLLAEKSVELKRSGVFSVFSAYLGWMDLLSLPYWKRMWTFPELYLSRDDPVCVYGNHTLAASVVLGDWSSLTEVFSKLFEDDTENRRLLAEMIQSYPPSSLWEGQSPKAFSGAQTARNLTLRKNRRSLCYMLFDTVGRGCFNPRDRIFSLYGLAPDVQKIFPVDYAKETSEIILHAAAYIIVSEGIEGLGIYRWFGLRESRLLDTSYPSWVPDFDIHTMQCAHQHNGRETEDSLMIWNQESLSISPDLKTLYITARKLGTCKFVMRLESEISGVVRQINSLLDQGLISQDPWKGVRMPEGLSRRIARLSVSHFPSHDDISTEEILAAYSRAAVEGMSNDTLGSASACMTMIKYTTGNLCGKTLFMLENGCFGIGGCDIEEGDVVTLPLTARAPLVLRKGDGMEDEVIKDYYRIVGNADVDGVMKGECLDTELVAELKKLKLQGFFIR